jgi:eukaryotic-like serine/threonine-protein kinase
VSKWRDETQLELWTTYVTRAHLGGAVAGQERYAEAEPLLASGAEGLLQRIDTITAVDKRRVTDALEQAVRFYTSWNKPEQAATWQRKLDAVIAAKKSVSAAKP